MAGTIISTPSIGASSWESWIVQQGATDTGYMRVSLTNPATTAASAIATGGVLECAGSIYSFTETAISLATGTASSAVAVYFNVIPSSGGTTVTVVRNSTAPVWVDAKQGFYASVASVSRVIGGEYIGTASTYYTKFLYTAENLVYCLQTGETRPLLQKFVDIGEWNMDATASIDVEVNVPRKRIRCADAWVRTDTGTVINLGDGDATTLDTGYVSFAATQGTTYVTVARVNAGLYDDTAYNATASTVANRGWITINYEA